MFTCVRGVIVDGIAGAAGTTVMHRASLGKSPTVLSGPAYPVLYHSQEKEKGQYDSRQANRGDQADKGGKGDKGGKDRDESESWVHGRERCVVDAQGGSERKRKEEGGSS